MKSYVLISTVKEGQIYTSSTEWNEDEMGQKRKFIAMGKVSSIKLLKSWLKTYLDNVSKQWLIFNQREYRGGVNCPNGIIQISTDIWLCKLDKQICDLQAVVEIEKINEFDAKCRANRKQKNDILRIIKEDIYKGFHHSVGRYQCPKCQADKNEEKYSFHYPWEFIPLIDLPLDDEKVTLLKSTTDKILSRFFAADPIICSKCTFDLISNLKLENINFELFEYYIDRKKLSI